MTIQGHSIARWCARSSSGLPRSSPSSICSLRRRSCLRCQAYGVTPAQWGSRSTRDDGHGRGRPLHRILQPANRPAQWHSGEPDVLLAIPTALLAVAPNLTVFTLLRVAQGLCMSSAFALMLSYLGEACTRGDGRRVRRLHHRQRRKQSVRPPDGGSARGPLGLAGNFYVFAAAQSRRRRARLLHSRGAPPMHAMPPAARRCAVIAHLRNPALRAAFAIGFCILFAFIGTFTYVNFVLVREPLSLGRWRSASSISSSCPRSSRRRSPATRSRDSACGRRSGARSPSRRRLAAAGGRASCGGAHRDGTGRRRHVLRAGGGDRIRRTRGDRRSRVGQRTLSRVVLHRRPRQRRARASVRSLRMGRMRRRCGCCATHRRPAGDAAQASGQ